jgi:acyl-coenzyme A thioesterase PaaI-like protein
VILCGGCRRQGTCRLGVEGWDVDGVARTVTARAVCGQESTGGPDIAHGGWTAAVFDDVLGRLPHALGLRAVTASLQVRYLLPAPADRGLLVQGRLARQSERRLHVLGDVSLDGTVLATAEVEMALVDDGHVDRHRAWLRERDATGAL